MLSTASHDLKAHLAAVQSLQQVILGGYAGEITEQQKDLLTRAGNRIKGLVSIIDDIFEIPRIEPCKLQMELAPLEEIARNSIEKARPRAVCKRHRTGGRMGPGTAGRPCRPRQAAAGPRQPARKRGQVYPGRRQSYPEDYAKTTKTGRSLLKSSITGRESMRRSLPGSSMTSIGERMPRWMGPAWDYPMPEGSLRPMAGASGPRAHTLGLKTAPGLPSPCQADKAARYRDERGDVRR